MAELVLTRRVLGSLGIPRVEWLEKLRLQTKSTKEYLFYDTSLNNHIENAFQALALVRVPERSKNRLRLTRTLV